MNFAVKILAAVLLTGCANTPVIAPPQIIEVPKYMPLPSECGKLATVDLPPGSSANDVLAKQDKALDELEAQIKRCFRPAGGKDVPVGGSVAGVEPKADRP